MATRKSQGGQGASVTAVADRLHSAAIHLLRAVRKEDVKTGIGPAQLSTLSVLVFAGPQTLSGLAAIEQVRKPTMSRIVAGLERTGLAARKTDPQDRRSVRLRATSKGNRVLQKGRRHRIQYLALRLRKLSRADRFTLAHAAALIEHLARPM